MSLRKLYQCVACERCHDTEGAARQCWCTEKVAVLHECPGCKSVWKDKSFVLRHAAEDCYRTTDEQRANASAALAAFRGEQP